MFFKRLFEPWPSLVVEETRLGSDAPAVHPQEAAQMEKAVPARRIEFATARWCARRALARLRGSVREAEAFALLNGPDRAPRWPIGVVGSITHTGRAPGGYCGVVVGSSAEVQAVGLDAEQAAPLNPDLWPSLLTFREKGLLSRLAPAEAGRLGMVIFSAKESFYKVQFPLSRRFLAFGDVEIALDPSSSSFEASLAEGAPKDLPLSRCRGRYLVEDDFVFTAIALKAGEGP
jgi:4'-phosphopantetheinyl transferase EntD